MQPSIQPRPSEGCMAGSAVAEPASVENQSTPDLPSQSASHPPFVPPIYHCCCRHVGRGEPCVNCVSTVAICNSNLHSEDSLIQTGEVPIRYSLYECHDVSQPTSKVGESSKNREETFKATEIPGQDEPFVAGYGNGYPRHILTWSTDTNPPRAPTYQGRMSTMNSSSGLSHALTNPSAGHSNEGSHPFEPYRLDGDGRELSAKTMADSIRSKWKGLFPRERVIFSITSVAVILTVITGIILFKVHGQGRKTFVRKVFVWGFLIIMANGGIAMFAVRRNLGEVLFAMTLIIVLGIFLNPFLDVLGYGAM